MDKLANEDHTHIATEEEFNVYRGNWWIRSNFVGSDTMPIRHRPDFKKALSTLRRFKNQEDQAYYQNWWQSSSLNLSSRVIFTPCCTCVVLSELFDLPSYFDLSFPVFFHSSVLMHPDLHTDLDNLDSVENNLRHSAKGSLDAYDVTFSLRL